MTIDIHSETVLTLRDAAASLPNRPHLATLHRWRLRGVRGVKLGTCLIGGRRFTSLEEIDRFIAAVSNAKEQKADERKDIMPLQRREISKAEKSLELEGI